MPARRTRAEKRRARQRRRERVRERGEADQQQSEASDAAAGRDSSAATTDSGKTVRSKRDQLHQILRVDEAVLRGDIIRSLLITLLLLGIIFGIVIYLRLI